MIIKTPLWAVQHCLSHVSDMEKSYCINTCEISELSTAADGVFIICGYINSKCVSHEMPKQRVENPHYPMYNIVGPMLQKHKMLSVVLNFPFTGTYYSPRFVADTSCLQSKGVVICNKGLASMHVLQMLPSIALHIRKDDGLPDVDGQLMMFTDVYQINIPSTCCGINTLLPIFQGVLHVNDFSVCIPPDISIGKPNCKPCSDYTKKQKYGMLQSLFVQESQKSTSNKAGCKRYIPGSFIAFPEKVVENPLVIDSCLIDERSQALVQV